MDDALPASAHPMVLIRIENEQGQTYFLERDYAGRIIKETDYWGQSRHYTYDPTGKLTSAIDPLGRKAAFKFDVMDRLKYKAFSDGTTESYKYDINGNLIAHENFIASVTRQFDVQNRLIKEIQPNGHVVYAYDNNDNLISRASSLGNEVTYQYDALNNVTHIAINDNGVVNITRDQSGAPVEETLSDITRKYAYTPQGLLSLQVIQSPQTRIERRYAYDVLGNLIEKKDSLKGDNYFTYDPSGRIIEHTDPSGKIKQFLHDPAGNLLKSVPNQTDASTDRMMEYDSTTYRFNAAGKLIEKTAKGDNQIFHWDGNDRLTKVQKEDGPCTQMAYDAIGRRICKETDDTKTTFLWDGDRILADSTKEIPSREYVFYPNSFEPLAIIDKDKQVYYFHNDLVGLPQEVTDSQGNVLWFATYDALGKVKSLRTNQFNNPIRMQGQYADDEIGLYYNRYRYYDPGSCSFISQDPLRLAAGTNLYRYVPNVWSWVDPLGLTCDKNELTRQQLQQIEDLRNGKNVTVNSVEDARKLLDNMPELRPEGRGNLNPEFLDRNNTFRGDLINKSDPSSGYVHAKIDPATNKVVPDGQHAFQAHYNLTFKRANENRIKSAIFIRN